MSDDNNNPAPPTPRIVRQCKVTDRGHTEMLMTYCLAMHENDLSFVAFRRRTYVAFSMVELSAADDWESAQNALHVVKGWLDGTITLFAHYMASIAMNYATNKVPFEFPEEWDAQAYRARLDDSVKWAQLEKQKKRNEAAAAAKRRRKARVLETPDDRDD